MRYALDYKIYRLERDIEALKRELGALEQALSIEGLPAGIKKMLAKMAELKKRRLDRMVAELGKLKSQAQNSGEAAASAEAAAASQA